MSDMSNKWDRQWSLLLTHCHGENVEAKPEFKAGLLQQLKQKAAENAEDIDDAAIADQGEEEKWSRLMQAAYVPCHYEEDFKSDLLGKLKSRQQQVSPQVEETEETTEDKAMRTILTRSYQPIAPRREFETRLLDNLKERQRNTTIIRKQTRRRTFFFSTASSIAAAAMVLFVVWAGPATSSLSPESASANTGTGMHLSPPTVSSTPSPATVETAKVPSQDPRGNLRLPVPSFITSQPQRAEFGGGAILPVSTGSSAPSMRLAATMPTPLESKAFKAVPASFTGYSVSDAFSGPALPEVAFALQNIEVNSGNGWTEIADMDRVIALAAGLAFRSRGGMGHLRFSDGSLVTVSPNAVMTTSDEGLTVERGLALISVPEHSRAGFRLHFSERDIAIEPGTDLAVMVESSDGYATGGAPAPMVMVVDREDSPGGLALARGRSGVGPLFAKQLYRLDRYVTADLPGRALCDTERQDLNKFFKMETVRHMGQPMASFAGGFAGDREVGYTSMVMKPVGYTKRGDKWVSDNYTYQPTVKLQYLSDEYFGFANVRRDLARDLSLGSEVIIDGRDGNFYEITK